MSGDDYQRVIDNSSVKGEILPAGRKLGRGEIMDLMRDCEIDPTKAGVRDTVTPWFTRVDYKEPEL
jgi:hypothetical protein